MRKHFLDFAKERQKFIRCYGVCHRPQCTQRCGRGKGHAGKCDCLEHESTGTAMPTYDYPGWNPEPEPERFMYDSPELADLWYEP